ncbi:MAG: HD domain-containing protein, partial [Candidatus Tectomicrobia bacterium]|nr:HD domain-containing protein [Candidatus Tectomicrobia bacterium]
MPRSLAPETQQHYAGLALLADPIHEYMPFTVPMASVEHPTEVTEKELIDTPWVQRLRYIAQLQSARWVFPGAEHSRFQHSLGAMHVAGRFARQLYPSLRALEPTCPSLPYVEALLRMAALLHDVGHGPFGHFFDENHLAQYGLGHEAVGAQIILRELDKPLRGLRRSPSGVFAAGEALEPAYVAYVMQKKAPENPAMPRWLRVLKPVLSGVYTADNLDYVLRDAYMCGVAVGPVDLERLLHYSLLTEHGLTLHKAGLGALTMFVQARQYLYTHVYFHRTSRALDLQLRDIFAATMRYLCPGNPLDMLGRYVRLTDWSLLETVRDWEEDPAPEKQALGRSWSQLLRRDVQWKMAYDATLATQHLSRQATQHVTPAQLRQRICQALPATHRHIPFHLDVAEPAARQWSPAARRTIALYDPATGTVE